MGWNSEEERGGPQCSKTDSQLRLSWAGWGWGEGHSCLRGEDSRDDGGMRWRCRHHGLHLPCGWGGPCPRHPRPPAFSMGWGSCPRESGRLGWRGGPLMPASVSVDWALKTNREQIILQFKFFFGYVIIQVLYYYYYYFAFPMKRWRCSCYCCDFGHRKSINMWRAVGFREERKDSSLPDQGREHTATSWNRGNPAFTAFWAVRILSFTYKCLHLIIHSNTRDLPTVNVISIYFRDVRIYTRLMSQALFICGQNTDLFSKRIPVSFDQNIFDIPRPRYHFCWSQDDRTISILMLVLRMRLALSHS